jgi:acyl-coenzyme A thioesterase PaaI-like protein
LTSEGSRRGGGAPLVAEVFEPGDAPEQGDAPPTDPFMDPAVGRAQVLVEGRPLDFAPHNCFACGSLNVGGLQLVLHVEGEACWTELVLPERFEGWEGIAHGGIVCTILDEVMAWALVGQDAWGLTARMTVEFKRPVRVGTHLRAEGRLAEARRRLLTTSARLVDADSGEVLATAEALYMAAPPDRKRELKRRYGFDESQPLLSHTDEAAR